MKEGNGLVDEDNDDERRECKYMDATATVRWRKNGNTGMGATGGDFQTAA